MDASIEAQALTKVFGDFADVNGIDLRVERGCFFGFLGPNGAGKSTTIKMLTGLMGPSSGVARVLGMDMATQPLEIKKRIGVVPEDLCLFENLTGREYLTFIARMRLMPKNIYPNRIDELLHLFDLEEKEKVLVLEYSHGMKKKLSLAAALIHDPELLFLDEPFEGIDAVASRTIRNVLATLVRREATIFLTSHILDIVEKLCSHVAIINKGQLISQGSLADFSEGKGLEQAFIDAVGQTEEAKASLSWLDGSNV